MTLLAILHVHTYQWYDKWFLESKTASDSENGIETGEHGRKENDLPDARVDGKIGKMVTKRG